MYANLLPRESKNSMAEFHQIEELFSEFNNPIEYEIAGKSKRIGPARENPFSSQEFKMIKIVERVLVTTGSGRNAFFPCEFQILTRQTYGAISKKRLVMRHMKNAKLRGSKIGFLKGRPC